MVPSRANSAWFWLIGRSWPSHFAQPFGVKSKANVRISPKNGSAISCGSLFVSRQIMTPSAASANGSQ